MFRLSHKARGRLALAAIVVLAFAVFTLVVRARPLSNIFALVIAVGSPYAPFIALAALMLALLSRQALLAAVAVLIMGATFAVQLPRYIGRSTDLGHEADIRVLSSNLRKGQADAASFVALASSSADVITVSELTPEEVERFSEAGVNQQFPYSVLIPRPEAAGIGLWSRFPLVTVSPGRRPPRIAIAAARLQVPGVRFDPLVASVHVMSPVAYGKDSVDDWERGIAATQSLLDGFADVAENAPIIVAGDFNSTPDMRQFRDLLTNGYRDAVDQTGAGFVPTFPADTWMPPIIAIDHVLTRNAEVQTIRAETIPGSDHRALLATVHIPTTTSP